MRDGDLYDALLDEFEPGARRADLELLFDELRRELVPLATTLTHAKKKPNVGVLRRDYPVDRQRVFCAMAAGTLGFDFSAGRLDTTTHPFFSTIGPGDCRLATRYDANSFRDGFFGTLHEVGHGLYDQGLDPDQCGTPLGDAASLAVHESQARLWENTVGRAPFLLEALLPARRQIFPEALHRVTLDRFHFAVNAVEPTLIRVQADEVTYNLHILIRFELERALITGDLSIADVPEAWNRAYRHYLGIVPANDADGCLQDGHWASGQIGYFPTYTLGNIYAAQLFAAAERDLGPLDPAFAQGDFSGLLGWLRSRIHREGMRYPAAKLIERATAVPASARALIDDLRRRDGELYGV